MLPFIGHSELAAIEREVVRADRFVYQSDLAWNYALGYRDANFFAKLAYQRAFLGQVRYIQGTSSIEVINSLRQAMQDFMIGLELGYPTESVEINNWFYRSLVVNDLSVSHFLAALPNEVWSYGDEFPRFQAFWGFAQLRGQKKVASKTLEFLYGLCFESDEEPEQIEQGQRKRELQENSYHLMEAIFTKDSSGAITYFRERARLRPIIPTEGTRYELFQPIDLLGLGLCRLATLGGMDVNFEELALPVALLDVRERGAHQNQVDA